jgi:hypothetical protein
MKLFIKGSDICILQWKVLFLDFVHHMSIFVASFLKERTLDKPQEQVS